MSPKTTEIIILKVFWLLDTFVNTHVTECSSYWTSYREPGTSLSVKFKINEFRGALSLANT